jgi:hypothetical protein
MIIRNKLDKTFGPFGTSAGFFLMLGGIMATYFSIFGLFLVIPGAFACFTSSSTFIDTDNKKIKNSDDLFGIIHAGKWIDINPGMKIGLKKFHRGYEAYIRGMQRMGIHYNDLRIFLYGSDNKEIIPLKKVGSRASSENELNEMSHLLELDII